MSGRTRAAYVRSMSTNDPRDPYRNDVPPRTTADLPRDSSDDRTRPLPSASDADGDGVRDDREVGRAQTVDRDRDGVADARQGSLHDTVVAREKERFGGMKFGAAFFGWLTALGALVFLTAVVAAIGAATGLNAPQVVEDAAEAASENVGGATIIGAIAIGIVLFVAYFAGGYVAGRMARFSGAKQGLAVWLWAIVIAILIAVLTAIAGNQWDILANVDIFPRIPVSADTATLTGILTAVGAAVVALAGAVLGGMTGMRYHRRVDRVGLAGERH